MASRGDGQPWFDVRQRGRVVGFVVAPSQAGGKWHAYLDYEQKAGSTRVGSYDTRDAAKRAVEKAAFG